MDFKCSILSHSLSRQYPRFKFICVENWMWILWKGKFSSIHVFLLFRFIFFHYDYTLYSLHFPQLQVCSECQKQSHKFFIRNLFSPVFLCTAKTDNEMELANFKLQPTLIKSTSFSCNCNAASTSNCELAMLYDGSTNNADE